MRRQRAELRPGRVLRAAGQRAAHYDYHGHKRHHEYHGSEQMSTRDRMIMAVICLAVAIVAPYLLVISPKRKQVSNLNTKVSAVQSQLQSVQAQLAAGKQAQASFASSYTTLVRLGE